MAIGRVTIATGRRYRVRTRTGVVPIAARSIVRTMTRSRLRSASRRRGRAARRGRRPAPGRCRSRRPLEVTPAGKQVRNAPTPTGSRARSPRRSPARACCCRSPSGASRMNSGRPVPPARRARRRLVPPLRRAPRPARRSSTAWRCRPTASGRGRRAAAGRRPRLHVRVDAQRGGDDPGAVLPRGAWPTGARRAATASTSPTTWRPGRHHQPARPHGHGDRPGDQRRHHRDRPRRRGEPFGVAFERTAAQGLRDEVDGPLGLGDRHGARGPIRQVCLSPPTNPLQADHPIAVAANPRRDEVYTANANSDTVSVIDTRRGDRLADHDRRLADAGTRARARRRRAAVSPDGKRLYVALGGENAVAVVDVARRRAIGFIPTAWHPVDVDITRDGKRLGRHRRRTASTYKPNRCAGPYAVGDCTSGDLIYGTPRSTRPTATMTKGVINLIRVRAAAKALRALDAGARRTTACARRKARKPSVWRDQARHLRDQGEPHLRPDPRRPARAAGTRR